MTSMYGLGTNGSSFINNYFGTTQSSSKKNNNSSDIYSVLSASSSLSDYSLIKSGAYKKLMKSYYSLNSENTTSKTDRGDSVTSLASARDGAQSVYKAAADLMNSSNYKSTGKDENGNLTYNMDSLYKKVDKLVSSYNSLHDSFENIESNSILSSGVNMVGNVSTNSNLLDKVGITIKSDNTLSVDESKFKSASINDIKTLFSGSGSLSSQLASSASSIYSASVSNIASVKSTGSSYTSQGSYYMSAITTYTGSV